MKLSGIFTLIALLLYMGCIAYTPLNNKHLGTLPSYSVTLNNTANSDSLIKSKKAPKTLKFKNGYWVSYYPNGNKKEEGNFLNNLKNGYWKTYYTNGVKKEEGEYLNDKKNGYWYFYAPNSNKIKEGHFNNNFPKMWWKYYKTDLLEKCLYQKDGKTRYCLIYKGIKLIKGRKYINDNFVNEWNSLSSFKKDNPNFSF